MVIKLLIGILIGAGIGAVIGHFGKCSSGGCPLTANPFRGSLYGAVMGALFALSSTGGNPQSTVLTEDQPAPGEGIIQVTTAADFNQYIIQASLPCLVDFYSDHCPPCRQLAPIIKKLTQKYQGRVVVCKINVDTATSLSIPYGIDAVPSVLFFQDGEEVQREIGLQSQETYEYALDQMLK